MGKILFQDLDIPGLDEDESQIYGRHDLEYVPELGSNEPKKSAKARAAEKIRTTLAWIYRFECTTDAIIKRLLNIQASGYLAKLANDGWLIKEPAPALESGKVYRLSEAGLSAAIPFVPYLFPHNDKIPLQKIRHELALQKIILDFMDKGSTLNMLDGEIRSAGFSDQGGKHIPKRIPDAIMLRAGGGPSIWIEMELTPKWGADLHQFFTGILDEMDESPYSMWIFSPSKEILQNYHDALRQELPFWKKNETSKRWVQTSRARRATEEEIAQFHFKLIKLDWF